MAASKVTVTQESLDKPDVGSPEFARMVEDAKTSNEADAMSSFYGQSQFQARFGTYNEMEGKNLIPTKWQTGLSNASAVSQLLGLVINAWAQDRFGSRKTLMFFMAIMALAIFIPFFSTSLTVLAVGQFACGIPWGVFPELVPTVFRPYVTAWVCMCWGFGLTISAGVLRVVLTVPGDWGWRLPISLQWIWPLPLFVAAYFAPESPWNAVLRGNIEDARKSLHRLRNADGTNDNEVETTLAYIRYTTELERAETENANFIDCFKGFRHPVSSSAGFSVEQSFDLNISLNACFVIGGFLCWLLFPHFGRAIIYTSGLTFMFFSLIVIGGLGFAHTAFARLAIGIVMIVCQLVKVITIGPVAYPIVAETPSGKLRNKTITLGRFSCVCTEWNWGAKAALLYAGTNVLCNLWCWFRLPETKDRPFDEIDLLFDNKVPTRKRKYINVDQFAANNRHMSKENHDIVTTTIENA
ncbi:MFS transporter, SP family, general alpha glucoside:H+ symporter [Colletotrichum salicis]|uniref:MFS transporter, SP family, general alpha glucoside:H+ symporter n=1 Tax=Colletotrichum salicis TaxID=1209931 RepID=A0A135V1Z0_9PEZI|nr:MFS transporter, SP family, general alpha glucoside:H+ symporter [Colletotrichum salicis]